MSTRAPFELLAEWNRQREGKTFEEHRECLGYPPPNIRDTIQHTFDDAEPGVLDPHPDAEPMVLTLLSSQQRRRNEISSLMAKIAASLQEGELIENIPRYVRERR
jgi:hypothetical protein